MNPPEPIIVIKKVKSGHGSHGGAWKVAYADFVTAMMALFIVLWLTNTSEKVQKAVGGYFRDPSAKAKDVGNGQNGEGEGLILQRQDMDKVKEKIEKALKKLTELQDVLKKQVQLTVTGEGLRIELIENEKGTFFESGNAVPTRSATELLASLSSQLGALPNSVLIEGHTDAQQFSSDSAYSNWELSADRANCTRRLMHSHGLRANQVSQVRGYADQKLKLPDHPSDASNRRISIVVRYLEGKPEASGAAPAGAAKKSESGHH